MKINILLPYKEKFDENKASSVSITVRNNLCHSKYVNQIRVFGQNVDNPLFKDNFIGLKHSILGSLCDIPLYFCSCRSSIRC